MNELDLLPDHQLIESEDAVAIARRELGDFSNALASKLLEDAGAEMYLSVEGALESGIRGRKFVKKSDLQRVIESYRAVGRKESAHPVPVKGRPETMRAWIKHIIEDEKGLSINGEMPSGLQAELIERAGEYGYVDSTAVKKAWGKLG